MPCYDAGPHDEEINRTQNRLDELTAMMCALCADLERRQYEFYRIEGLAPWWRKHKAFDEARRKK